MTDGAASCSTPVGFKGKTQMSSALRERLKRSRRSFSSPFRSPVTTQRNCCLSSKGETQDAQEDGTKRPRLSAEYKGTVESSHTGNDTKDLTTDYNTKALEDFSMKNHRAATAETCILHSPATKAGTADSRTIVKKHGINDLLAEKCQLQDVIDKKEETLRRLNLVKTHKDKGDLSKLQQLTARWQQVSQQVLLQLQERTPVDQRPSLGQLMDHMGIDEDMLELDREQDCFRC